MKNITEYAKDDAIATSGQVEMIQQLAHDLRQPLSSIECIGYYLDMVLGEQEPELQKQCEMLRRLVQQAHWLLEDASLTVSLLDDACSPMSLSTLMRDVGEEMERQDQQKLELRGDSAVMAVIPAATAARFCEHAVAFFRDVADAADPIYVTMTTVKDVFLEIRAEVTGDLEDLTRAVLPKVGGGLKAFVEAAGGQMAVRLNGRELTLTICLPRGEQSA